MVLAKREDSEDCHWFVVCPCRRASTGLPASPSWQLGMQPVLSAPHRAVCCLSYIFIGGVPRKMRDNVENFSLGA
jgi:hypothetical protein